MSYPTLSPNNYSFHAIAGVYALAFPPYVWQFVKGMTASNYQATNLAPRTNLEILKSKVDSNTWQKLVKARGAHLNALEGFPLFAAAMVCSQLPKVLRWFLLIMFL